MRFSASVGAVVDRFARSYPWVGRDDLSQEAALTLLEIERRGTWRPDGAPLATYQARAVGLKLAGFARVVRSPVTGSQWILGKLDLRRAPVEEMDTELPHQPDPGAQLDRERALDLVRAVVALSGSAARDVLLGERSPAEVARSRKMTRKLVYRQIRDARRRVLREARKLGMG